MLKIIRAMTLTTFVLSTPLLLSSSVFAQQKQNIQNQVSTQISTTSTTSTKEPMRPNLLPQDTLIAEATKPAVVRVVIGCKAQIKFNGKNYTPEIDGHGSGFFVNPNGYIVTNAHVVDLVQETGECKEILAMKANLALLYRNS
jgi:S1-C subfamily serine protease